MDYRQQVILDTAEGTATVVTLLRLPQRNLLRLSACNTATAGSGANGKEVEGFGVLAQRQGAKAVVASLGGCRSQHEESDAGVLHVARSEGRSA
jgi:CHAT domain-containing protein